MHLNSMLRDVKRSARYAAQFGRRIAQTGFGGVPAQARIGDGDAVAQVGRMAQFLVAFQQVGLQHHALDGAVAVGNLVHHVFHHQSLQGVVFA